jgi:hypothetical protein
MGNSAVLVGLALARIAFRRTASKHHDHHHGDDLPDHDQGTDAGQVNG